MAEAKEVRAIAKFVRTSPRKAGKICDLVRGKSVEEAIAILKFLPNSSAEIISKVVKSAAANAENNFNMESKKLYVSKIWANQGPTLKRFRPRAQGRATSIRKRTAHIEVFVQERN